MTPPASSSTPPTPFERASTVWASLILDLAALAAIVLLAKWKVVDSTITTSALFVVLTGRVVAKAGRGSSGGPNAGGGGVSAIGGVLAFASAVYAIMYRGRSS